MNQNALKTFYTESVIPAITEIHKYSNPHQVPKLLKVVINSGIKATEERNWINELQEQISNIAAQQAIITKAKVSISNFKLREGMPIGVKVTLRGSNMYSFLHRLLNISLPIIRDFRGVSTKMDGNGNFTLGITDHTIFPEIRGDGNKRTVGMDITIVTSANTDEEGRSLLKLLGMPFKVSSQ